MIYILLVVFLIAFQLIYFWVAKKLNIIAVPNGRSSHIKATIVGGGIIFYVSILTYFLLNQFHYPWVFSGLSLITIVSFIDDIKPLPSKLRLAIQAISVSLLIIGLNDQSLPWYMLIIGLVIGMGILNAYNFMDGINGMMGSVNVVVIGALWYINHYVIHFVDEDIILFLLLALMVFNIFNFRTKPTCFAGDVGAFSLGFAVVFLIAMLMLKSGNIAWIGLLTVYGIDSLLTILHRLYLKENILVAHRKHLFQLLVNELRIPHLLVSFIYASIQFLIVVGLIVLEDYAFLFLVAMIILLSITYYLIKRKYFYLHQEDQQSDVDTPARTNFNPFRQMKTM